MKKILLVVLLLLLAPKISNAVSAEAYVVMDYDTGRILSSKNPEKIFVSMPKKQIELVKKITIFLSIFAIFIIILM